MMPLSGEEKQVIFDYCMGLSVNGTAEEARKIIDANPEAAELQLTIKNALSPLSAVEDEQCPDELVRSTLYRLNNAARSSQLRLKQLIEEEQRQRVKTLSFWPRLGELLATAAVIIFVAGVMVGPLRVAREDSWQKKCNAQLGNVFAGVSQYSQDHDGQVPSLSASEGNPWWKVGYNGPENHSNTRPMWILVQGEYVSPKDFVCPGKRQGVVLQFDKQDIHRYNDFPARRYVTYSTRVVCDKSKMIIDGRPMPLIADVNPLFENLPKNYSEELKIELNEELKSRNSSNHNGRGQNVLFCDGSAKFKKTRKIGITEDDIFTLRDTNVYHGYEVPSCESDSFLAP